jgi:hypothetical protein
MNRSRSLCFFGTLIMVLCLVFSPLAQEKKEAEEFYTIKKGDTLWDISSKFLSDPFLWPKLWQRNPYITNPHWIYPGQPIRLSATEEVKKEEPKKVVVEEKPKEAVKEPGVKKEEIAPIEKKPEEQPAEKKPVETEPAETKPVEVKAVEEKPMVFPEARTAGFFSDIDYRGIGIVIESKEGKSAMIDGDILYLAFRAREPVSIGDKYTVFRASELISHPVTGKKIGRRYNITGNIQIIDRYGNFYTAKVIQVFFDGIFKGDLIRPYTKDMTEVEGKK